MLKCNRCSAVFSESSSYSSRLLHLTMGHRTAREEGIHLTVIKTVERLFAREFTRLDASRKTGLATPQETRAQTAFKMLALQLQGRLT